ncbi:MAG: endolytic transglycosylase MltG [Candidatus Daviesbacteria bacterium]|nr:endolytic transglycosylase MltG [Candidatus Daviesbacteria bacterium]
MKNKYTLLLIIIFLGIVAMLFISKGQRVYKKVFITPTPTPTIVTEKKVTLIEGWRVEEMAVKLSSVLGVSGSEFIKEAKEGYMFPDTYMFDPKATPSEIVTILRANFEKKYDSILKSKIQKLGLTTDEGVTLASIVEREARSDEVRRMVASILLKRLKIDMGLNADATIQYALIPKGTINPPKDGWWKRHLTRDDLKIQSPYNTYLYRGLPPTPISNPSLSSLEAVANADPKTPYLYYYHDSKGNSYYAKTLEEHNQNVASYP